VISVVLEKSFASTDVSHHSCPAYLRNLVTFTESDSAWSRLR